MARSPRLYVSGCSQEINRVRVIDLLIFDFNTTYPSDTWDPIRSQWIPGLPSPKLFNPLQSPIPELRKWGQDRLR